MAVSYTRDNRSIEVKSGRFARQNAWLPAVVAIYRRPPRMREVTLGVSAMHGARLGRLNCIEAGPLRFDGSLYVEGAPLSKAAVDVDDKVVAGVLAVVLGNTLHTQMLVELPIGAVVGHEEEALASKLAHMLARDLD